MLRDMAKITEDEYNKLLIKRVKALLVRSGLTQAQAAEGMGVLLDTYKKWEQRTLLPRFLYGRFCITCRCTLEELVDVETPLSKRKNMRAVG